MMVTFLCVDEITKNDSRKIIPNNFSYFLQPHYQVKVYTYLLERQTFIIPNDVS